MKKTRKFLALLLSLALALGVSVSAFAEELPPDGAAPGGAGGPGGPGGPGGAETAEVDTGAETLDAFSDAAAIQNQDEVSMLISLGIVGGTKVDDAYLYNPSAPLTRAEAAKMVALAANVSSDDAVTGTASFDDVADWAKDYVAYVVDNGIMTAEDGKFNPNGTVTDTELSDMLSAALGVSGTAAGETVTRDSAAKMIADALTSSGKVYYVTETTTGTVTLEAGQLVVAPAGKLVTLTVNGEEKAMAAGTYENATLTVTDVLTEGALGSWSALTGLEYRTAVRVKDGAVDTANSVLPSLGTDTGAENMTLNAATPGFSAVIVEDSDYTIKGANINLNTDSDGHGVNDFAGLGAAVAVYGDSDVVIEDSTIATTGVAKAATFADSGADLIVRNSSLSCAGGDIYPEYKSTANQSLMVNPPWVLGISGSARTTNVMGDYTTGTYVNTDITAANWGAVSIDTGNYMHLTLINSDVKVDGSGYGAYAIGTGTYEDYYGTSFDVETYAIIMTGATVNLNSVKAGDQIEVKKVVADDDENNRSVATVTGETVTTETAVADANTVINSDNFGFMFHQNASDGWNVLNVNEGTEINTGHASFLVKKVNADINIDGATVNAADGVILQMIDNDDDMVGAYMDDVFGMPTFNMTFSEPDGWSSTWGVEYKDSGWQTEFSIKNTSLKGNLYNGTGYTSNGGQTLNVILEEGGSLEGTISATEIQHGYSEDELNKTFTYRYDEYNQEDAAAAAAKLGHVINQNYSNGVNKVNVTLKAGSTWTVTEEGIINSLTIEEGATFNGTQTVNEDGTITVAPLAN